ncbi:MAG: Dihydrodipicolinate synthase, partial [Paramarteilia canceri]
MIFLNSMVDVQYFLSKEYTDGLPKFYNYQLKDFTGQDLSKDKPILVAVGFDVFDVSSSKHLYDISLGGPYSHLAGRNASLYLAKAKYRDELLFEYNNLFKQLSNLSNVEKQR